MAISVLIVDDSFIVRTLVRNIVASDPELLVVGEAENGAVALDAVEHLSPQVVLLDIEMPKMNGIAFLERLQGRVDAPKVIVLSSVAHKVADQVRALGAAEIIVKPSGAVSLDLRGKRGHEIVAAIRKLAGVAGVAEG